MAAAPTDAPALGFWKIAEAHPEHLALVDPDEREISAGELLASCNQLVHGLRAMGLQPGDAIAMLLPNRAEVFELFLAVGQAGFYLIPINWHLVGPEIAYIVDDCEAKVFVADARFAEHAAGRRRRDRLPGPRAASRSAVRSRASARTRSCRTANPPRPPPTAGWAWS